MGHQSASNTCSELLNSLYICQFKSEIFYHFGLLKVQKASNQTAVTYREFAIPSTYF